MKKCFFIGLLLAVVLGSCKKYNEIQSDVNDDLYIYGRLNILDSINNNGVLKPLSKMVPVLLYYKDSLNPVYSTQSDADGYFKFLNLTKGKVYTIKAETELGDGNFKALYSVYYDVTMNQIQNSLTPVLKLDTVKQNGALYLIKDNATRGLINNCSVCFFSSLQLYLKDSCEYSQFSTVSNTYGMAIKANVLPGHYYVLFKKQVGATLLKATDIIDIPAAGIIRKEILLQ